MKMFREVFVLIVLFHGAYLDINYLNIKRQKQIYETNHNSSISVDRKDRILLSSWTVDLQVKRVDIITKYRLQMIRHKEHNFRITDYNPKWNECVFLHRQQIRKSETDYYANENQCLTTTTAEDQEMKVAVKQVEKEIHKWRKGYKYLIYRCNIQNTGDEKAADACLVQYMERDNYHIVIQRLLALKQEAMRRFHSQLDQNAVDLEECLKNQLSAYLEKTRSIMDTLNQCYSLLNINETGTEKMGKSGL